MKASTAEQLRLILDLGLTHEHVANASGIASGKIQSLLNGAPSSRDVEITVEDMFVLVSILTSTDASQSSIAEFSPALSQEEALESILRVPEGHGTSWLDRIRFEPLSVHAEAVGIRMERNFQTSD